MEESPFEQLLQDPDILADLKANPSTFKFKHGAELVVTGQMWGPHLRMDPDQANTDIGMDGIPTTFPMEGPMPNVLDALANALNFTYKQLRPSDGSFGAKLPNGTWTGMIGQVVRNEVDLALGPFGIILSRYQVTDFTVPIYFDTLGILAARGSPEIDPWGFLMPMTSQVWMVLLLSVLGISLVHFLMELCPIGDGKDRHLDWSIGTLFRYIHAPLNQGLSLPQKSHGWHRVILGTWFIGSILLSWSYGGTLMSHMASRHIPEPIETIRDLIEATHVKLIFEPNTVFTETIRRVQFGDIKEMNDLQYKGRYVYLRARNFMDYINLIKNYDHVQIFTRTNSFVYMGRHFSQQGRCDFYWAKENFLPFMFGLVVRKNSPITPALDARVYRIIESGLYYYWVENGIPNSTACANPPTKVTLTEPIGINNIWGVAVFWSAGILLASFSFFCELLFGRSKKEPYDIQE